MSGFSGIAGGVRSQADLYADLGFPRYRLVLRAVNLTFHEAGHVLFMPFGRFLHVLGGSLGQLIVPAVVIGMV